MKVFQSPLHPPLSYSFSPIQIYIYTNIYNSIFSATYLYLIHCPLYLTIKNKKLIIFFVKSKYTEPYEIAKLVCYFVNTVVVFILCHLRTVMWSTVGIVSSIAITLATLGLTIQQLKLGNYANAVGLISVFISSTTVYIIYNTRIKLQDSSLIKSHVSRQTSDNL